MKVWVVLKSYEDEAGYAIVGVHQVEQYAWNQANELMQIGEWSDPIKYAYLNNEVTEFGNGHEVVTVETVEVKY